MSVTTENCVDFMAGAVSTLVGKNEIPTLEQCLTESQSMVDALTSIINDTKKGTMKAIVSGIYDSMTLFRSIPTEMAGCKTDPEDT